MPVILFGTTTMTNETLLHLLFFLSLLVLQNSCIVDSAQCKRRPIIFNFGDSNSDTGGASAGLGSQFGPFEGRIFPTGYTGRLCDGRLIIDFLCESVNSSYLSPYLESLGPNFTNGANFAIAGAGTLSRERAFSLHIQVQQFLHFKNRIHELASKGSVTPIDEDEFPGAIYTIDIGQNDIAYAFTHLSYSQVIDNNPLILNEIKDAVQTIYNNGGRNFWLHSTGPLGCLPQKLSICGKNTSNLDPYGCLINFNSAAKSFNDGLRSLRDAMQSQLSNATIVYTDVFAIKYDLIVNSGKYGFDNPLMACCGNGGPPYNFNPSAMCGGPGSQACTDGSRYASWDGVHYTEAANAIVASRILSANYSTPALKFDYFCNQ
ncbi:GDSL esterase/lipase LIP-4 [Acorus gramineus]|uniref:GDSL esterase/lipase LIP-4 n=1 Tax=Acorus gramineus TaxID=55184 RepID=A0AAV9BTH1_ACOGR|nr:GDSL esterase/lipase LIP-4 [Acorus gramineus]